MNICVKMVRWGLHPRRWQSWRRWRRWFFQQWRWQPSSIPVYSASSTCSTQAATAALASGWWTWIASNLCTPFQTWKCFSFQKSRRILKRFSENLVLASSRPWSRDSQRSTGWSYATRNPQAQSRWYQSKRSWDAFILMRGKSFRASRR